ncbi:MAG: hypothetical protein K6A62_04660 [Bacteroidales bacterium]|nr:hypothetical protein [Bacteroidales bacterium]
MNDENLIPTSKRSKSETRELGHRGGIASGRSRRIKSRGRQLVLDLLEGREADPQICAALEKEGVNPKDLTREVAMHLRQIDKAIRTADTKAYNAVLKAAGLTEDTVNVNPTGPINITLNDAGAAEGLRKAIATGAQPRQAEK